jgi:hypothetical protein
MSAPSRIYTFSERSIDLFKLIYVSPTYSSGSKWYFVIYYGEKLYYQIDGYNLDDITKEKQKLVKAWEEYHRYKDGQDFETKKALQKILVDNKEEPDTLGAIDQLEVTAEQKGDTQ